MKTFLYAERSEGSPIINLVMIGDTVDVPVSELEKYIVKHELNKTCEYGGNSGCGEPWNDNADIDSYQDTEEYLLDNIDQVCKMYVDDVINYSPVLSFIEARLSDLNKEDALAIKDGDIDKSNLLTRIKCELMDLRRAVA